MKKVFSTSLLLLMAMFFGGNAWADTTTAVVRATYVSGTDTETDTSFGEIAAGSAVYCGYNKISNGTVALGNKSWNVNYIAYLQVDASSVPGTITGATLEGDFQQLSQRELSYGVGYNSSEWKSNMTWNTADRTITALGAVVKCSKTTVDKHISYSIKNAFMGDADKIVTILVYQTAAGGGYIKNPTVTVEYTNAATAAYTIKYMYGGTEIKEAVTRIGVVGEHPVLEDDDTEDVYFNNKKYIYSNSNVSSQAINSGGTTVYTVSFREAASYNWTLNFKDSYTGSILGTKTGTTFEGDKAVAPYSKYLALNGQLYSKDKGVSVVNEFNYTFTLNANNEEHTLYYDPVDGVKNIVYCSEAEDIEGMVPITAGNAPLRSSNAAAAYAPTDVVFTKLPVGKYKLHVALYDGTSAHNSTWTIKAGNEVAAEIACQGINFTEYDTNEFVIQEETELSISAGGNGNIGIDHIYIIKTGTGRGDDYDNMVIATTETNKPFIEFARNVGWIGIDATQMTAGEAALVRNNEQIWGDMTSLDELRYFTGITEIGYHAFTSCQNLISITLPPNITSIHRSAFEDGKNYYCKSLQNISISEENPYFKTVDGILYNKEMDSLICYPFAKQDKTWTTPSTLRTMSWCFNLVNGPLKEITFTGAMQVFYTPGKNADRGKVKITFLQAPLLPTMSGSNDAGTSDCDYYIPKGTLSDYKNMILHNKVNENSHIYEVDGDVVWSETIFGAPTDFSTYYDYDGDGVMEYLSSDGFYDKNGNKKGTIALPSKRFSDNREKIIATPINGNGDLLAYSFWDGSIQRIGGFEELTTISLLVDVDNDGRKDFVKKYASGNKFTIYYQQPDGTFKAIEQSATMDEEAAKAASSSSGGGVVSFADGMMVKAPKRGTSSSNRAVEFVGGDSFETGSCTAVDMNDDGILDLINNGTPVLYSYDDNKFFIGTKSRMLCPCDLNGDGEMEYVCYDGSTITLQIRESGTTFSEKTLFTNSNVKQIIYKDFDHDGDIDILAYIYEIYNGNFANGTTYFVFFRNDGDLSFKRRERNFAVNYQLKDIKDVDADGFYEMLVIDYTNKLTKLLKIGEDLSVVDTGFEFTGKYGTYSNSSAGYDNPVAVGDFDNDGKMDYRHYVPNTTSGNKYGVFSQAINTAPQKMEAPTAILNADKGRLRINWKQGTDAETSACDLTYELRIGTQPASGDILFGASLVDGTRRTLEEGNMGRTLSTLFNAKSLKPGKYYISVQAIDGGGRGGAWSDDFVYEHQLAAPVIVSNYTNQMSTADTLQLSVKAPVEGATYQWTLCEGRIIKDNGSCAECVFEHDGEHTISLVMTIDGKTLNAEPLTISVDPAKYVSLGNTPGYIDINQDGYPEYLGYVNNGEGKLEKVMLSYTTSNPRSDIYMDYNMDGYPDAISKNTVYINLGEQDNDFDMETQQFDWKYYLKESSRNYISVSDNVSIKSMWFDANNDGYLDNRHCFNDGTNIVWRRYYSTDSKHAFYDSRNMPTNMEWNSDIQSYVYLLGYPNYDVNRDGMLDIVEQVREYSYGDSQTSWYVMYKDSTANFNYSAPQLLCTINKYVNFDFWLLDDINNDGYMDIICSPSGENTTNRTKQLIVFKGNPTSQSIEPIIYDIPVYVKEFSALRDYNNDGYLDLCFEGYDTNYDKSNNYLCMFGPDFSMEFVEWTNKASAIWDKYFMVQNDGGYPDGYASNIKNLPPSAPATVAAKQTKDGLLITWSDAQDDHTPAMQMRYNISVKRKGKKGDNSFVISPMNGLKDAATICGNIMYKKSTQMLVPASLLTAGETYEIQVQAIDLWNQHSPMTPVVEFTMVSDGYIDMAEQVAVGMETSVKYVGTNADSYSLNAGADGTIVKDEGNGSYIVKWSSEGVKNITLTAGSTTVKSAITVVKPVDLTFSVAGQVFAGAPLVINVSDEMTAQPKNIGMRVVNNNRVKVDYVIGSKAAVVTFPEIGTYELEAYSTDPIKGNSYKQTVEVSAEMPAAVIEQVDVDDETGFYTVNWDTATLPAGISKVAINKEGRTLGAFNNLTTVDAATGRYIDKSSTPAMMASRYHIQLIADNGQTSEVSAVHKPLHVMIAKAVKGYNLIWDHYEGLNVGSYNILRGSSPDNLQTVAQVAGSINSYTDTSAPDGTSYYAVTFSKTTAQAASRRVKSAETTVGSNVISTEEAVSVQQAQSIELIVLDDDNTLSDSHPELQLYYMLLPTYTTISKVSWEIVSGADIATIDANGKLRATGSCGTVTVRVSTIDGSELSDEINIVCTATDVITDIHEIAVTTDSEAVLKEVRYFTLDGKRIDTAVKGQVVIEWSIYSNGQISVRKRMKE